MDQTTATHQRLPQHHKELERKIGNCSISKPITDTTALDFATRWATRF